MEKLRISAEGCYAAPAPTGSRRPKPVIERYENRTFNFGKQLRARRTALE
jgi:hypothetical protein